MAQGSQSSTPQLPENLQLEALPDSRGATRLLAALEQLEKRGRPAGQGDTAASPSAEGAELTRLAAENRQLRQRQRQAIQRLDNLLEHLPAVLETAESTDLEHAA